MCETTRKGTSIRSAATPALPSDAEALPLQGFFNGETRTRTGDTTIFSRVLYQLSYLAAAVRIPPPTAYLPDQARSSGRGSIG